MSLKIKISIIAICFALVAAVCIGFVFASPNETVNMKGMINYEVPKITITASPNDSNLGSTNGSGDYSIGDTINLSATRSGSNSFLAWATSTNPNTMEILSTSTSYSFELTEDSPTTYYALFNQTTSTSQTVGDLVYTFYNEAKLAEITGMDSSFQGGDYTISPTVTSGENSYKVYSIGDDAFRNCSSLTSITIPKGVTSIGDGAFSVCKGLTSITLPGTLTSIGNFAFQSCSGLTSIIIPEGVTSIGEDAFPNCSGLTSITLPSTLTSIGNNAFINCSSLEAFYGNGNSYYTIDGNRALIVDGGKTLLAYAEGNAETSYSIPEGVTSIGISAFEDCSSLASITLPSTLTSIGHRAFFDCSGLTEITINGNITSLGTNVFYNCSKLTSLTLGEGVTSIPSNLFTNNNLTNLTEIVVLGNLRSTTFPTGTWLKGGATVTSFTGAGTYIKS